MKLTVQDYQARIKVWSGSYYTHLSWVLVLLAGTSLLAWVILPYFDWRETQLTHIEQDLQKAAKLQALQRSVQQWQEANTAAKAAVDTQVQGYFDAATYAQAQQDLFNLISVEIKDKHLKLMTHSFLDSAELPAGEQVALELNIQGGLADVIRFIDVLSHHQKRLSFSSMHIINDHGNTILRLTVAGYRLAVKTPQAKPQEQEPEQDKNPPG